MAAYEAYSGTGFVGFFKGLVYPVGKMKGSMISDFAVQVLRGFSGADIINCTQQLQEQPLTSAALKTIVKQHLCLLGVLSIC